MNNDKKNNLENGKQPLTAKELKEAFDNMTAAEKEAFLKSAQNEIPINVKKPHRSKLEF